MCYKYKQIMLTGNGYSDTKQLELTWGDDAVAMSQEECCKKKARSSVTVRRSKLESVGGTS